MNKPLRPCASPGCPELVVSGRCKKHRQAHREYDRHRGSSAERGYNGRWQKARAAYLRMHPLCAECERSGKVEPANVVDHIKPHRGDMMLFWDMSNWQSLCKRCHDVKTAQGG
jgi:5-methylcytosine-specific restriction protein A